MPSSEPGEPFIERVIRRLDQLVEEVRRPGKQMDLQEFVQVVGLVARKVGHERQHEADVILGGSLIGRAPHAVRAHPRAQLQRALAEHHAFAVGVHRAPGRGRLRSGTDEQTAVLPHEVVGVDAVGQTVHHQAQSVTRFSPVGERPRISRFLCTELRHRLKRSARRAGAGILQEKRGERLAHERHGLEFRLDGIHAIVHRCSPHTSSRILQTAPSASTRLSSSSKRTGRLNTKLGAVFDESGSGGMSATRP